MGNPSRGLFRFFDLIFGFVFIWLVGWLVFFLSRVLGHSFKTLVGPYQTSNLSNSRYRYVSLTVENNSSVSNSITYLVTGMKTPLPSDICVTSRNWDM